MSRIGNWILELEEEAYILTRDEFVLKYGSGQAHIWDRINGLEEPEWDYDE